MRARRRKKKKSINIKWSLIWIFLHSISLFVIGTLLQYINLKNNFFQILFLGFGISLLARVMRVFTANKKFAVNKWFVFWSVINSATIFVCFLIFSWFNINNYWLSVLLTGFGLVVIARLVRQLRLSNFLVWFLIILLVLFLFLFQGSDNTNILYSSENRVELNTAAARPVMINTTNTPTKGVISNMKDSIKNKISNDIKNNSEPKNVEVKENSLSICPKNYIKSGNACIKACDESTSYGDCPKPCKNSLPLVVQSGVMGNFGSAFKFQTYNFNKAFKFLVDSDTWKTEADSNKCYTGKYHGQYPEKIYCDNILVSRWEKTAKGTIESRWYTAMSTIWKPRVDSLGEVTGYEFEKFICENGQSKKVNKEKTSYDVIVTQDGTKIKIQY